MSYSYAVLEVSKEAFDEIAHRLYQAGYSHAFHREDGEVVIDMQGIAIKSVAGKGSHEKPKGVR